MARTITVKGTAEVSAKPDYIVLSMILKSHHMDYDKAMEMAAKHIRQLNQALEGTGFEKGSLKTTNFNVRTDYDQEKDQYGNYRSVFNGYDVNHNLKLAFDFSMDMLSRALSAIAGCPSHPQLSVSFTVKDASAINEEMLRSAAASAKRKAEILCDASGVTMGDLLAISCDWGELEITSRTRFDCYESGRMMSEEMVDIEPDDIEMSDTATFVWEIR